MAPKKEMRYPGYISLRLEQDLQKKLEELAAAEDRSVGYVARALIREGLAAWEKKGKGKKAGPGKKRSS